MVGPEPFSRHDRRPPLFEAMQQSINPGRSLRGPLSVDRSLREAEETTENKSPDHKDAPSSHQCRNSVLKNTKPVSDPESLVGARGAETGLCVPKRPWASDNENKGSETQKPSG